MKKLLLIIIGFLTFGCANKKKEVTEPKTFEEVEMELENYSEEDRKKELEYLKSEIFKGLENLNNGFDSEDIFYFSESDFETVLDRVEKNGLGIYGIEPWLNDDFYGVSIVEDYETKAIDSKWYRNAFAEFKKSKKKLMYAATYEIPKKLIEE